MCLAGWKVIVANKAKQRAPFFAIEGSDSVGKATQTRLLRKRLETDGHPVYSIAFPRYDQPSCHFVKRYLAGEYGTISEVAPKLASAFFALDRFDSRLELKSAAEAGQVVVADRYVASNLAHQGAKIGDPAGRKEFFDWVLEFEYGLLKVPRPDLQIVLLVEADTSHRLRTSQSLWSGTEADIHESDDDHQRRSRQVYLELCRLFPDEFVAIDCQSDGQLKSPEEIAQMIYAKVSKELGFRPASQPSGRWK